MHFKKEGLLCIVLLIVCLSLALSYGASTSESLYDDFVYDYNDCLCHYAIGHPQINYHKHLGFSTTPIAEWSRDGIHPNTALGHKKYVSSTRRAILSFPKIGK